jgi:hypothetical protein
VRRVLRRRPEPGNLDSFLDVMTNTVGVLIFVLLFVTLAAADATVLVRTPLRSETEKRPIYFEAVGGRVIYLELGMGNERVDAFFDALPPIRWYNVSSVLDRVDAFQTQTSNYTIDFSGSPLAGGFGVRWQALAGAGDTVKVLKDSASAFQGVLRTLDPDTAYLAFVVRPDGLEAFRAARKLATRRGLASGWEPFEHQRDLVFSSGGRSVGVQ